MKRISGWLNDKPYTKAMYLTAIGTFLMAGISGVMCWTVIQNRKALELTRRAVELQEKEFLIRNRPLVDVTEARFAGPAVANSNGKTYPRSIELKVTCISDVPAMDFKAICKVMLNDKRVATTIISLGALAKGKSWIGGIYLSEDVYQAAIITDNRFWIDFHGTYSGVLGEEPEQYGLTFELRYDSVNDRFGFSDREYR